MTVTWSKVHIALPDKAVWQQSVEALSITWHEGDG